MSGSERCSIPTAHGLGAGTVEEVLLSRLVEHLALSVEPFGLCEVEAGHELDLGDYESTVLHFGLAGRGVVERAGVTVNLVEHGLVIVPPGVRHQVRTEEQVPDARSTVALTTRLTRWRALGERNAADMISACGRIQARYGDGPKLFGYLREPLAFEFDGREDVRFLFDQILQESTGTKAGSQQMLTALMSRCLVLVLRELCEDDQCALPWLSALEDSQLGSALDAILSAPGHPHSVESLAAVAAMGRTTFVERFQEAFNAPPMTFLREVRLRRAAALLEDGRYSVAHVARMVGFSSRAHFATAFSKRFGQAPSEFRRRG